MKHLRTLLMCLLVIAGVGSMEARLHCDTIRLTGVPGMEELSVSEETGYYESWFEFQSVKGVPCELNEWIPQTGEIRVNKDPGEWGSNFVAYCSQDYPHPITKITMVLTTGALQNEDVEMKTLQKGAYSFQTDHIAIAGNGFIAWDFKKADNIRRFRIEVPASAKRSTKKVVVPYILVQYNDGKKANGEPEEEESVAEEENPGKEYGGGDDLNDDPTDPRIKPEPQQKDKGGWATEILQGKRPNPNTGEPKTSEPQQPQQAQEAQEEQGKDLYEELKKSIDPTKPAPPGETNISKKNLLDPLTEEEFLLIRKSLPFGEECEKSAREWVKKIPDIKKTQSAECLAELRALTYDDYLQFVHAFLEALVITVHDFGHIMESDVKAKEEAFVRQALPQLVVLGPELVRLYDIQDPKLNQKMNDYCNTYIRFYLVLEKYKGLYKFL